MKRFRSILFLLAGLTRLGFAAPALGDTVEGTLSKWNPQTHVLWVRLPGSDRDLVLVADSPLPVQRGQHPGRDTDLVIGERVAVRFRHEHGQNRAAQVQILRLSFLSV